MDSSHRLFQECSKLVEKLGQWGELPPRKQQTRLLPIDHVVKAKASPKFPPSKSGHILVHVISRPSAVGPSCFMAFNASAALVSKSCAMASIRGKRIDPSSRFGGVGGRWLPPQRGGTLGCIERVDLQQKNHWSIRDFERIGSFWRVAKGNPKEDQHLWLGPGTLKELLG